MCPGVCLAPWLRVRAGYRNLNRGGGSPFSGPLWRPGLACGRDFKPSSKFYFKRPKNPSGLPHNASEKIRSFTLAVYRPRII